MRAALGVMGTVVIGAAKLFRDRVEWCDAFVEVLVRGLHTRLLLHDARILSEVGPYLGAALVLVALVVASRRGARPVEVRGPLMALALALLCVEFLKLAVCRDRPFPLEPVQHDSFPSGDTAQVALCAATALHLLALRRISRDWLKPGIALIGGTAAIVVGLSRIYLGRHWVSDVAASLLIGLIFWKLGPHWPASARKLGLVVAGIVVVVISGPRVVLPSPTSFEEQRHFELPVAAAVSPRDVYDDRRGSSWDFPLWMLEQQAGAEGTWLPSVLQRAADAALTTASGKRY